MLNQYFQDIFKTAKLGELKNAFSKKLAPEEIFYYIYAVL